MQAEKVTVVFPMRFNDSVDTVLATSFLQVELLNNLTLLTSSLISSPVLSEYWGFNLHWCAVLVTY